MRVIYGRFGKMSALPGSFLGLTVTVHGFPVPSSPCLVCVCAYVWAGVCGVCVIEADSLQLRVITVGLYLSLSRSLLCQILAVFAVDVFGPFWFRDSWALLLPGLRSPDLGCPLLPCATRLSPTESSVSAYGKLRVCLGKLRLCPTESSASAYGSSASALRKAPFSFSLCITSRNKLSFPQLNPPVFIVTEGSDQSSWIQRRLVVCKNWYPATTLVWISRRRICWTPDELCRR